MNSCMYHPPVSLIEWSSPVNAHDEPSWGSMYSYNCNHSDHNDNSQSQQWLATTTATHQDNSQPRRRLAITKTTHDHNNDSQRWWGLLMMVISTADDDTGPKEHTRQAPGHRVYVHSQYNFPNLARLHGHVNGHWHCTCEVCWLSFLRERVASSQVSKNP